MDMIKHAQSHCLREYLHLRYTQKLSYMLAKFKMSPQTTTAVSSEIERVKQALLTSTSNFNHIK